MGESHSLTLSRVSRPHDVLSLSLETSGMEGTTNLFADFVGSRDRHFELASLWHEAFTVLSRQSGGGYA